MSIIIPFVGQAYTLNSLNADAQSCKNWYPEAVESGTGKASMILRPSPGLTEFATFTGGGAIRGMYAASEGTFFVVCGNKLSSVTKGGTVTELGTIYTEKGIVRMTDNGTELILVDGNNGWTYNFSTTTLAEITDTTFPKGNFIEYIDGYFINNDPDTQQYYWSNLNDGTTWDGTDFASAEGSPDNITGMIAMSRELWIFGTKSMEVYYNSGDADTPFQRIENSASDIGCVAPDSIARMENNIFWVGASENGHGQIFTNSGYTPIPISNYAVEQSIQTYTDLTTATGFCYQEQGHEFYQVSFPSVGTTWVFDKGNGMWHERTYTNTTGNSGGEGSQEVHLAIVQEYFQGRNFVGDRNISTVYVYDSNAYSDNGEAIHRERSSPHIWNNLDRVFYSSFELDIETGVGLVSGQGEDPQVMLDWSNDGGHTWSTPQWRSFGKMGEYKKRVKWNRLGSARDRIFRIKVTDPVKAVILGAAIL